MSVNFKPADPALAPFRPLIAEVSAAGELDAAGKAKIHEAIVAKGGNAALESKVDAEAEVAAAQSMGDFLAFAEQGLLKGLEEPTKENRTRVLTDGNWSFYKKQQIVKDNVYMRTFGLDVVRVSGMVDDLTKMANSGRPMWETFSALSMLLQEPGDKGVPLITGSDRAELVTGLLGRLTPEQLKGIDATWVSAWLDGRSTMKIDELPNDQRRMLLNFALSTGDTKAVQKVLSYSMLSGYQPSGDPRDWDEMVDKGRSSGEEIGRALAASLKEHPESRTLALQSIVAMAGEANKWGFERLSSYFSLETLQSLKTFLETDHASAAALSVADRQVLDSAIARLQWWSEKPGH